MLPSLLSLPPTPTKTHCHIPAPCHHVSSCTLVTLWYALLAAHGDTHTKTHIQISPLPSPPPLVLSPPLPSLPHSPPSSLHLFPCPSRAPRVSPRLCDAAAEDIGAAVMAEDEVCSTCFACLGVRVSLSLSLSLSLSRARALSCSLFLKYAHASACCECSRGNSRTRPATTHASSIPTHCACSRADPFLRAESAAEPTSGPSPRHTPHIHSYHPPIPKQHRRCRLRLYLS